jgi:hypothetical protein
MIRVQDNEKAEHLKALHTNMFRSNRLAELLEARLKIVQGRRDLARIRFWDVADSISPEISGSSGWSYDPHEKAFIRQGEGPA